MYNPAGDDHKEHLKWHDDHFRNGLWGIAYGLLGIIILGTALIVAFSADTISPQWFLLFFLGNLSYGLFFWHRHVDKKLHKEHKENWPDCITGIDHGE